MGKRGYWCGGRLPLYIAGFCIAGVLDPFTPLGIAEWLIEVTMVCIAAIRGGRLETIIVATVATVWTFAGLWASPTDGLPLWLELLNRLGAIVVIWTAVYLAAQRRKAEGEVRILQGLLPICASCKRIRHDDDQWENLESYISEHSEATFTHGLCPGCAAKYYEELERT